MNHNNAPQSGEPPGAAENRKGRPDGKNSAAKGAGAAWNRGASEADTASNSSKAAEDLYAHWTQSDSLSRRTRAEWRNCCRGGERAHAQRALVEMARIARVGVQADQLALYKAAHAVLPLHGSDLGALVELLLQALPVPLEWCDALISLLAEQPYRATPIAGMILNALRAPLSLRPNEETQTAPAERLRRQMLRRQLFGLGYRPEWLPPE